MNNGKDDNWIGRVNPLAVILLLSPAILYAIVLLLPTFDDWTYYTAPSFDGLFNYRLLPNSSYWRPFDAAFGWLLGLDHRMFPALNHIVVYAAHVGVTVLVYRLATAMGLCKTARNIGTVFFFISPAMLGTVYGVDALNQACSHFFGLLGLWHYFNRGRKPRVALWLTCVFVATLWKENGIMFFFIAPLFAFGISGQGSPGGGWGRLRSGMVWGVVASTAYFALRIALTTAYVDINHEYFESTPVAKLLDVAMFIGMAWVPVDYVSLVHAPSRNLLLVAATAAMSMPFIVVLLFSQRRHLVSRPLLTLAACMVMAALPHLLTIFTTMHSYAGLSMAALMVAFLADKADGYGRLAPLFAMFVASCLFVDWHHWQKSYDSGLMGRRMGREAIEKTGEPVDSVYIVSLAGHERKYSSFCVLPADAFAWGNTAVAATGYKWPAVCRDTVVAVEDRRMVDSLADRALALGFKRVWLVHGDTVDVIR